MLTLGALHGIWVQSHCSELKVGDTRITRVVHEDVWLDTRQYNSETEVRMTTYSLEIPMNHIAGVEVAKALCDIG